MDAGSGVDARLRLGVTVPGLAYVAGVLPDILVFEPGHVPAAGHTRPKSGRRQRHVVSVKQTALGLPAEAWKQVEWREGTAEALSGRLARVRACSAHRHRSLPNRVPEWLLIEWPDGEQEPTRYWLSTLPEEVTLERLVETTKLRWRIERDYQELKQELGLDHFEGRSWRGFHHHATLCTAAYGFLIAERATIPPQDLVLPGQARCLPFPKVTDREAPPLRPERHIPNSIATMRRRVGQAIAKRLPRCPCCGTRNL